MGYWMWDAKRKSASVSKKMTERIDLPETGFLSSIYVVFAAENGSSYNEDNHLHDCVTKIEVVGAGGETLKSLTGVQGQGLNWFDKSDISRMQVTEGGAEWQAERWMINFGRYWKDTEYMLDCGKVIDGQLKITWDLSAVRAVSDTTAFKDANAELGVVYAIPHDFAGPAPKGYIKSTETKSWTSEASGINYVKIPRNNPIRRIMVRCYESGVAPTSGITNLKLNGDSGKVVPWDNDLGALVSMNMFHYPVARYYINGVRVVNGDTKEIHLGWCREPQVQPITADRQAWPSAETHGKVTIGLYDTATPTAISSEELVRLSGSGWGFHNCVMLPFDIPKWNEELLLQAQALGSLDLEVTQGNAGAAVSFVTEEVVKQS